MKFFDQCMYDLLRIFNFVFRNYRVILIPLLPLLVAEQLFYLVLNEWISPLVDYSYYPFYNFLVAISKYLIFSILSLTGLLLAEIAAYKLSSDTGHLIEKVKSEFKPYLVAYFLFTTLTLVGFMLLVIPGLVANVLLSFLPIAVLFKKLDYKEAIWYSYHHARPLFFRILIASIILQLPFFIVEALRVVSEYSILHYVFNSIETISGIIYMIFIYLYFLEIESENEEADSIVTSAPAG